MITYTRNVGSRTRSSQIQTLAWNKLKGKSLQLAFRWWKVVKDVHFLVLLKIWITLNNSIYICIYIYVYIYTYVYICIYSVQNTQHLQGF